MFATVVLSILTLILLTIFLLVGSKTKKCPPGPFAWPIFGNQFLLKRLCRDFGGQHEAFLELRRRYDSDLVTLNVGSEKVVVISGRKLIHIVLKNEEYDGRPWNEFIKIRNMGKKQGITMNDGVEWKELRNWMVRNLRIFGFGKREMSEMIREELQGVINGLNEAGVQQIKPLLTPAVLNVVWCFATGKPFGNGSNLKFFCELLDRRAQAFDMIGGILTTFPWIRYLAPEKSGYNLLLTLNNELKSFLKATIDEHRRAYKPGNETDLIDAFLREMMNNENENVFCEDQLILMLLDLFIAGCTTTGITLDFAFLNMVVHQDVQRKLHEEIDSVIPRDRVPALEDRAKLPYAEAVLNESQRMYPVFPIIGPRRVLRDTIIDDYHLPKDTTILINIYSINKDPVIYPEPNKFFPERFLKNGLFEPDSHSVQFGKGKRRCPGEVLARGAMFLLFIGVMQKFRLLPVPGRGPNKIEIKTGITISPKPYEVLVVPR